jgi:hypothetical protein
MDKITNEQLEHWFKYHSPDAVQQAGYTRIRDYALQFAKVIRDEVPACADATVALRKLREVVMTANQAIACGGR